MGREHKVMLEQDKDSVIIRFKEKSEVKGRSATGNWEAKAIESSSGEGGR